MNKRIIDKVKLALCLVQPWKYKVVKIDNKDGQGRKIHDGKIALIVKGTK